MGVDVNVGVSMDVDVGVNVCDGASDSGGMGSKKRPTSLLAWLAVAASSLPLTCREVTGGGPVLHERI